MPGERPGAGAAPPRGVLDAPCGRPAAALRHALVARDWSGATGVLAERWYDLVPSDHEVTLRTPVCPPPADALDSLPELALAYAADRLNSGDLNGAAAYLRLADGRSILLADERRNRFGLISAALRLTEAQLDGDVARVKSFAPQVVARADAVLEEDVPGDEVRDEVRDERARAVALSALGSAHVSAGDLDAAEEALSGGLVVAARTGLTSRLSACTARLALLRAIRGDLQLAGQTAHEALAIAGLPEQDEAMPASYAYLAIASVCYQRDQLADAQRYLDVAAHTCGATQDRLLIVTMAILRALLLQAQGNPARASQVLLAGRRELALRGLAAMSYLERWLVATDADVRTSRGDTDGARALLEPLIEGAHGGSAPLTLALAWTHLADGDATAAVQALHWADDGPAQTLWFRLDGALLDALAASVLGDAQRADRLLEDALRLAEPEGCRRVFKQPGSRVRKLLLRHLDSGTAFWPMLTELIEATDERPDHEAQAGAVPSEPLSDREMTVLRYLQSMLSNDEIAAALNLSVHTVKTHARHIYRKLGVGHRRDAVHRGRELRLL